MLDAARGIVSAKGVQGLYSGLGVTVIEIMPYAALQFGLYDALKAAWNETKVRDFHKRQTVALHTRYRTYPTFSQHPTPTPTHMYKDSHNTLLSRKHTQTHIYILTHQHKYTPMVPTYPACTEHPLPPTHTHTQKQVAHMTHYDESHHVQYDTRLAHFSCGLLAGLFAKLATHPLDVAKKRYQVAGLQRSLRSGTGWYDAVAGHQGAGAAGRWAVVCRAAGPSTAVLSRVQGSKHSGFQTQHINGAAHSTGWPGASPCSTVITTLLHDA